MINYCGDPTVQHLSGKHPTEAEGLFNFLHHKGNRLSVQLCRGTKCYYLFYGEPRQSPIANPYLWPVVRIKRSLIQVAQTTSLRLLILNV